MVAQKPTKQVDFSALDVSFSRDILSKLQPSEDQIANLENAFEQVFARLSEALTEKLHANLTDDQDNINIEVERRVAGSTMNGTHFFNSDLDVFVIINSAKGSAVSWDKINKNAKWSNGNEISGACITKMAECALNVLDLVAQDCPSVRVRSQDKRKIRVTYESTDFSDVEFDVLVALKELMGSNLILPVPNEEVEPVLEQSSNQLFASLLWKLDETKKGLIQLIKALKLIGKVAGPREADPAKEPKDQKPLLKSCVFEMAAYTVAKNYLATKWNGKSPFHERFIACLTHIRTCLLDSKKPLPFPNSQDEDALVRLRTHAQVGQLLGWLDFVIQMKEKPLLDYLRLCLSHLGNPGTSTLSFSIFYVILYLFLSIIIRFIFVYLSSIF